MINIRQKAIELLAAISDTEKEALRKNINNNEICYAGIVPAVYQDTFIDAVKDILSEDMQRYNKMMQYKT